MEVAAAVLLGIGAYEFLRTDENAKSNKNQEGAAVEELAAVEKLYDIPDTLTNHEIIDKIMDGSIPSLDYNNFDYTIVNNPQKGKDKEFVDESRELKDICTDIVVNLFLESPRSNFNFLKKVYETFDDAISYYGKQKELPNGSLILVYKGGNVLRIISNEFLRELPGAAANEIQNYYKNFFKRSDADFSIYIDPNLENYDRIYNDMILVGFVLQRRLRQEFMSNKTDYFDFYKYNHDFKAHSLEPYFKKMKSINSLSDPKNKTFYNKRVTNLVFEDVVLPDDLIDLETVGTPTRLKYVPQPDKSIQYTKAGSTELKRGTIVMYTIPSVSDKDQSIYVQANETLDFEAGGKVKFALVRSKINFNIYIDDAINVENILEVTGPVTQPKLASMKGQSGQIGGGNGSRLMKQIGGELIDLSFPHREDSKLAHFYDHLNRYLHRYELRNNDDKIEFNSYSLIYLIEDLEFILFKFVNKPWDAPKYEKRLNRLFYLYMIDIFNKIKTNPERKQILESFVGLFNDLMVADIDQMPEIIDNFEQENEEQNRHLLINNLLNYLRDLPEFMTPIDIPSFRDFLKVLLENTRIILDSFKNVGEYCSIDGSIRLKNIYEGDLRSLV